MKISDTVVAHQSSVFFFFGSYFTRRENKPTVFHATKSRQEPRKMLSQVKRNGSFYPISLGAPFSSPIFQLWLIFLRWTRSRERFRLCQEITIFEILADLCDI